MKYYFKIYIKVQAGIDKVCSKDMTATEAKEFYLKLKATGETFECLTSDGEEVTYKEIK